MVALHLHEDDDDPVTVLDPREKGKGGYRHLASIGTITAQKKFKAEQHVIVRKGGLLMKTAYALIALVVLGYVALVVNLVFRTAGG